MAGAKRSIPRLDQQGPAVDFIDNRLGQHHSMFDNPPVYFNPTIQRYVSTTLPLFSPVPSEDKVHQVAEKWKRTPPPNMDLVLPPRPADTNVKAMVFWTAMFPEAMTEFRKRSPPPKDRDTTPYDIRNKLDWESVYDALEAAKEKYSHPDGFRGKVLRSRRRLADKSSLLSEAARMATVIAPDNTCTTPVLGSIKVILEAVKTAKEIRELALGGYDDLISCFSEIELFLGMFPDDENIKLASVELTVSVFDAVERGIDFFISNEFSRLGKAMLMGGNYGQKLVQSLKDIKEKSAALKHEAEKSQMYKSNLDTQQYFRSQQQLIYFGQNIYNGVTSIYELLTEHDKRRKEELLEKEQQRKLQEEWFMMQIREKTVELQYAQSQVRYLEASRYGTPVQGSYMNQEALRRILDISKIDNEDIAAILDMKGYFPLRERAQADHIIQTTQFRQWMVAPVSTKLLVHWEPRPSKIIGYVSPLSIVCCIMADALRSQARFLPMIWFGGKHVNREEIGDGLGPNAMIRSFIDQLLRQSDFDMRLLPDLVDPTSLEDLIELLTWLIRQLPGTRTVCCIVDGVVLLEREEYAVEAFPILLKLVELVRDDSVVAPVKLLFTTTGSTIDVRAAFEAEGLIMNVGALYRPGSVSSEASMARELGLSL